MKYKIVYLIITVITLATGCTKDDSSNDNYTGIILRESSDCQGANGSGKAIVIKMDHKTPDELIYTLTLPYEFKVTGAKIRFKARSIVKNDELLVCNTQVIGVNQMVVFDVKTN